MPLLACWKIYNCLNNFPDAGNEVLEFWHFVSLLTPSSLERLRVFPEPFRSLSVSVELTHCVPEQGATMGMS